MAEWSNAAVLKTVDGQLSGGSNPSLCAKNGGQVLPAVYLSLLTYSYSPASKFRGAIFLIFSDNRHAMPNASNISPKPAKVTNR